MDLNLAVIGGRLAAPPELRRSGAGAVAVRYLVTVRSGGPRPRIDVLPVTRVIDDEAEGGPDLEAAPGQSVWIAGSIRRRFGDAPGGGRSTIELAAHQVALRDRCHEIGPAAQG